MRLLGTSTRSSRFPHPPPPSCLSSCPPVFLSHFLVFPLPPDRPAADRSKVISPWFVLDGLAMVPALAPFSSWPRGLVPGLFLVLASRLLYENMAYRWWISWTSLASLLPCTSSLVRRPFTTTPCVPSSVPSSRMADGSRVTLLVWPFSLLSSSTSESDGQLSSPQRVICCGLLCLSVFFLCSSSSIFPPMSLLRYGMVGAVADDGAPRSLSDGRSSGVRWTCPFFVLWQFPCSAPSLLAAVVSPCTRSARFRGS